MNTATAVEVVFNLIVVLFTDPGKMPVFGFMIFFRDQQLIDPGAIHVHYFKNKIPPPDLFTGGGNMVHLDREKRPLSVL